MTKEERREYLDKIPSIEETRSKANDILKDFQDATIVRVAESYKNLTNKLISETEGIDGLKPVDVLERIITYSELLIEKHTRIEDETTV